MKRLILPLIMLTLFLGGCFDMSQSDNEKQDDKQKRKNAYEKENFVPVQDYTGEGYTLRGANSKTGEIAEAHRDDVDKAVKQFFQDTYKTKVKIHNIVSAKDGVSVFVESVGEPQFYTYAIVPVDVANKEVKTDEVWSQEGQVERAIQGGLYAETFEKQFSHLDDYLAKVADQYPVASMRTEAIENVGGHGYTKPSYFISPSGDTFKELYDLYEKNPHITKQELRSFFEKRSLKPKDLDIAIKLYMADKDKDPSEAIYDQIYADIKDMKDIPSGEYYILLHDNDVDRSRADGEKDNTIDKTIPNGIEKEF